MTALLFLIKDKRLKKKIYQELAEMSSGHAEYKGEITR